MANNQALKEYVNQLRKFQRHMEVTFEALMHDDADGDSVDHFYRSDFEIKWRGKTVTLGNGAEVFQGIEYIIAQEIDELEMAVNDEEN